MQNALKFNLFANEKSERWNGPSAAEYVRSIMRRCEIKHLN